MLFFSSPPVSILLSFSLTTLRTRMNQLSTMQPKVSLGKDAKDTKKNNSSLKQIKGRKTSDLTRRDNTKAIAHAPIIRALTAAIYLSSSVPSQSQHSLNTPDFHLISFNSLQETTYSMLHFLLQNTGKSRIPFALRLRVQLEMPPVLILDRSEILPGKDEILMQFCWVGVYAWSFRPKVY